MKFVNKIKTKLDNYWCNYNLYLIKFVYKNNFSLEYINQNIDVLNLVKRQ